MMDGHTFKIEGYVKPEDDYWVAICVNMGVVAQGKTGAEALATLLELLASQVGFLGEKHPEEWSDLMYHDSPDEFMQEYDRIRERYAD